MVGSIDVNTLSAGQGTHRDHKTRPRLRPRRVIEAHDPAVSNRSRTERRTAVCGKPHCQHQEHKGGLDDLSRTQGDMPKR